MNIKMHVIKKILARETATKVNCNHEKCVIELE